VKQKPRFSELNKVRVAGEEFGVFEGYVIASLFKDGAGFSKFLFQKIPENRKHSTTGFRKNFSNGSGNNQGWPRKPRATCSRVRN
jgi:hypothetical protein